jgi:branched-chain amino acid aminotransferase
MLAPWRDEDLTDFGRQLGPLLVMATHHQGRGWTEPRLTAREELRVGVAAGAVQYGLSVFEGLKAHRGPTGAVALFRPDAHARRLRTGVARLGLPDPGERLFLEVVAAAVRAHEQLVPRAGKGALYIRPTQMAFEESLGLRAATRHVLCALVSTAPPRAPQTLGLWVDEELMRVSPGGLAAAKTAANYASALFGRERARRHGYDDALWLDGRWGRYVTETGTMNVFAVIDDVLVTPALDGHIMPGVTRACCIDLARSWQVPVEERPLSFDELQLASARGRLREIFAVGTTAGVVSVAEIGHPGGKLTLPAEGREQGLAHRLREELSALQEGRAADVHGWLTPVPAAARTPTPVARF